MLKINPYLKSLIKENQLYILGNIFLIAILAFFIPHNLSQIPQKNNKINLLTREVKDLQNKAALLSSPFASSQTELDETIKVLNALVPNAEDYFSIIYALEELSRKTNFFIESYSVDLRSSNINKLQLVISGVGDQDAFLNFLREYNFGGGRLITSERIELLPNISGSIKLTINFYSKDVAKETGVPLALTSKQQEEINELKNKISFLYKGVSPEENLSYPKKTNPF